MSTIVRATIQKVLTARFVLSQKIEFNGINGLSKTIIANIAAGKNVVSHDLGIPARIVQFWYGEAPINFYYTRLDSELNNDSNNTIVIESEDTYENVEINIIAY